MTRLSPRWVIASALLVSGGLALAAIPAAVLHLEGDLAADAMIFFGAALGGLVAALASQRRAIGEVGLGALLTLVLVVGLLLVTKSGFFFELDTADGRSLFFRRVAVYVIGSLVGAAVGGRRRSEQPIASGGFWAIASMLATMGVVVFTVVILMQLDLAAVALGLVIVVVTPTAGAFAAQLMAPMRRAGFITLGAASPMAFALIGNPSGVLQAGFAGLMCAGMGAIGVRLALKLRPRPDEVAAPVPHAQAQS